MAKQVINIGTTANDGTGETVRSAFDKINDNFTELYIDDAQDVDSVLAGTGISVDQTTGSVTVTNSAPDQTVSLTDGGDISVSGAYPNFTLTNSAPDQTVVITDSYGIDSIGTYPNFTLEVTGTKDQNGLASELKYWSGTQAEYDALTPDANTIYFVI